MGHDPLSLVARLDRTTMAAAVEAEEVEAVEDHGVGEVAVPVVVEEGGSWALLMT